MACMATIYPPALLGHDEQELLNNSGLPAAAWVQQLRVVPAPTVNDPTGAKLQAIMGDAPQSVCKLINRRAYRQTSAEIYDEPPGECADVPGVNGKVLRAVAFLGREIPKVKRLEDIPQFNEETGQSTKWVDIFATGVYGGKIYRASDLEDMKRNHGLLSGAGVDPSKFSEAASGACCRVFMEAPGDSPMDELRKKLIALGMPAETVNAMDDTALAEFAKACAGLAGGATPAPTDTDTDTPPASPNLAMNGDGPPMTQPKPDDPLKKPDQYSEDAVVKRVLAALGGADKLGQQALDRVKQMDKDIALRTYGEKARSLVKSGKIAPSVNQGDLIQSIAADMAGTVKLTKFGDKEMSLDAKFGLLLDRLASQETLPLEERAPSGDVRTFSESQKAAEVNKVKAHYERHSETFRKMGTSQETFVKAYEFQAVDGMTAAEYCGE